MEEEKVFGTLRRVARDASGEHDGGAAAQTQQAPTTATGKGGAGTVIEGDEATEVLLYGFGEDLQWSAIDHYERVANGLGTILEDYDRTPASQLRAYTRSSALKKQTLSKAALRKKNKWAGGAHWIKITFSSRDAAELACARSPHLVKSHMVYAEPWQGRGPARDEPIVATTAGVQATSGDLPSSFSTNNMLGGVGGVGDSPNGSQTISSRTVAGEDEERTPTQRRSQQAGLPWSTGAALQPVATPKQQLQHRTPGTTRLRGAQRATLLPAEQALMPKPPKASWGSWMGAGEVIGSTVPRQQDGTFDWARASLYWRLWWWVDGVFGTDFCGLRGDD